MIAMAIAAVGLAVITWQVCTPFPSPLLMLSAFLVMLFAVLWISDRTEV